MKSNVSKISCKPGFTQDIKKDVILNLIQDLQRRLWYKQRRTGLRGRSQIKFGMTPLYTNGGFTLIELLVVVLIIGILAAVAVPQYQKAVEKSRITEAILMLRSIYQGYQARILQEGATPGTGFDDLFANMDIELPGEIETCPNGDPECIDSKDWRFHNEGSGAVYAFRLGGSADNDEGEYLYHIVSDLSNGKIYCGNNRGTTCTKLYGEDQHELN